MLFEFVSNVAVTPVPMAILRLADKLTAAAACSVALPENVRLVAGAEGTAPRAASALMLSVPELMIVPPP